MIEQRRLPHAPATVEDGDLCTVAGESLIKKGKFTTTVQELHTLKTAYA